MHLEMFSANHKPFCLVRFVSMTAIVCGWLIMLQYINEDLTDYIVQQKPTQQIS